MRPKMPVLIITPDIRAETWAGAAGWALGNQTCKGNCADLPTAPQNKSKSLGEVEFRKIAR